MPDIPPRSVDTLERENAYLKQRNAQLQEDVTALTAEGERLRQILERLHGRSSAVGPDAVGRGR
jgi:ABC-type phosphate transport system auxiliary subunit